MEAVLTTAFQPNYIRAAEGNHEEAIGFLLFILLHIMNTTHYVAANKRTHQEFAGLAEAEHLHVKVNI